MGRRVGGWAGGEVGELKKQEEGGDVGRGGGEKRDRRGGGRTERRGGELSGRQDAPAGSHGRQRESQ